MRIINEEGKAKVFKVKQAENERRADENALNSQGHEGTDLRSFIKTYYRPTIFGHG